MTEWGAVRKIVIWLEARHCPKDITDALFSWGLDKADDEIKLKNWVAFAEGKLLMGQDDSSLKNDW